MARFNSLFKVCNAIFPFADFTYILQLEEYSSKRLLRWLPKFFFKRNIQKRERLVLTARAKITILGSFIGWGVGFVGGFILSSSLFEKLLHVIISFFLVPFSVLVMNTILSAFEEIPRKKIRQRAAELIANNTGMNVVAIAGSYGKTTTKNFVYQLTRYTYRTQMIPGNINTPAGIANWIIANLRQDTELLIAEVDAYQIGEIAKSCDLLNADIAVLTNIGDQHLERFASPEDLKTALLEVFSHSKPNAILISDDNTKQQTSPPVRDRIVTIDTKDAPNEKLSASNQINFAFALEVAKRLNVATDLIHDSITKLELPERRQQQTTLLGYEGIDDSYNISFSTAKAGIAAARNFADKAKKKLLVITAGIPELSPENRNHNAELGKLLSEAADHAIILGSDFAHKIAVGFGKSNSYTPVTSLKTFISVTAQNFKKDEWYLLLQPELNDLYY